MYGDPLEHPQNEEYWGNVNPIGIFFPISFSISLTCASFFNDYTVEFFFWILLNRVHSRVCLQAKRSGNLDPL